MYLIHQSPSSRRVPYVLAAGLAVAAIACMEKAVSFYSTARTLVPTDEHVQHSLEAILRWRDAAGQRIETVDVLLKTQAYDYARDTIQAPYLTGAAATGAGAAACLLIAVYVVAGKNKRIKNRK
ncbi:MAG: hypothetical protein Q7R76_06095 [Candidatus Woesearchaeota archaeon]|nr:hypothetical protein [Candidatus Woesearchaeota archaeon]